jgi:S-(hydroxymethyl)glutathione dehydrogenase / alcohol dehydrogenase
MAPTRRGPDNTSERRITRTQDTLPGGPDTPRTDAAGRAAYGARCWENGVKAAVMYAPGQDMVVEDLDLEAPRAGELLVRLAATGVCHTDLNAFSGNRPLKLPMVLGHEGAGVVEGVGSDITTVAPGDHVVLTAVPRCGKCESCVLGQPQLCRVSGRVLFGGTLLDGSTRLRRHGEPVYHFFAQSSYAEYAVVPEGAAVPIPADVPLDKVAPLACGVSTGLGAVFNAARPEVGATIAIIGCGGVGLSAVMAAHLTQARTIVAVDIAEEKLALARSLGATHVVNGALEDPLERVRELTGGGAAHVFEFVGNPRTQEQMVQMIAPGGHGYIVGAAPAGSRFSFPTDGFLSNKHLHGVMQGNIRASVDIPRYVELFRQGKLPLERLVTRTYRLDQINEAFHAFETGVGRGVIAFA